LVAVLLTLLRRSG
jgi:hypothetical protein